MRKVPTRVPFSWSVVMMNDDDLVLDGGDNDDEGEHTNMYMNKYGYEKSPNASPLLVLKADDVLGE